MGYMCGWYSEEQARFAGTCIYLDKDGNEVEVSSVSGSKADRPKFADVKLVAMVRPDGFLRRFRDDTGFQEFELYARLLVINRQAQIQNTAHPPKNQLTLVNESGTDALVWLIGPLEWAPMLEDKESTTVHLPAGSYYIRVRYGMERPYLYFRGEEFNIIGDAGYPSHVTIVFRRTADDSYKIYPISASEFVKGLDESIKRITGESR